jgi:DNA-binding CsgD family transcriptional regulator
VAREHEVERLTRALDDPRPGRIVLLDGEAGIGKTTVWEAGVDHARRQGCQVLRARPAAVEAGLPFAALGDILEPILDEVLPGLPGPQGSALESALLRRRSDEATDRLAVARATLGVLRLRADGRPTLLAIDDVQWLDPASAEVFEFAIRRLDDVRLPILLARRGAAEESLPLGLDDATGRGRVDRISLGPMDVDELDALLRTVLELRLARPTLLELHQRTSGNPFFALEIARTGRPDGERELRIPDSLGGLLRQRLDELDDAARAAILLVARAGQPTAGGLPRAMAAGSGAATGPFDGLTRAIGDGILVADGERVRFSHPLFASVAENAADPWQRRQAHQRLAAVVDDPADRARHLALATDDPDAAIASTLEEAARVAARRGAPEAAAMLLDHAARLTPPGDAVTKRRRLADAADQHIVSGDPSRGRDLLRRLVDETPPGPERAGWLWRLADAGEISLEASIALCETALAEAGDEPALRTEILNALNVYCWITGRLADSAAYARQAAAEAERTGDDGLVATSLGEVAFMEALLALPIDEVAIARAIALEDRVPDTVSFQRPSFQLGIVRLYTDRPDEARPLLEAELARVEGLADASARCGVLFRLTDLALRTGDWAQAEALAARTMASARQGGIEQEQGVAHMIGATVQAHLGILDRARGLAEEALAYTERTKDRTVAVRAMGVMGLIELSRDDPSAALRWLTPAREELQTLGIGELSISLVAHNEVEGLIALDRLADAEATIAWIEDKGRPADRSWHAAVAARGRALVAAARGDMPAAREHLRRAFAAHERLPQPFELARTRLAAGTIERRAKQRGEARVALTRARDAFEALPARCFVEKANAELARVPGRRPGTGELTETERRVAEHVARGLSNKEVAAKLFISVRTVEANLSSLYAKLGVRSRTELAAAFTRGGGTPEA